MLNISNPMSFVKRCGIYFLILLPVGLSGQIQNLHSNAHHRENERGLPVYQDIPLGKQLNTLNYDIIQARDGLMYTANGNGVAIYDGRQWELFVLPDKSTVFTIEEGLDGKIYVGSMTDMGYLTQDDFGNLKFISLKDELPQKNQDAFIPIEYISSVDESVAFISQKEIMIWNDGRFDIINQSQFPLKTIKYGYDSYQMFDSEFIYYDNGKLNKTYQGTFFDDKNIVGIQKHSDSSWIVATAKSGVFIVQNGKVKSVKIPGLFMELMDRNDYYVLGRLGIGNYLAVFGTGDVLLLDSNFRYLEDAHLIDDPIEFKEDRSGAVWLVGTNNIIRYRPNSALTVFDERSGIEDNIIDVQRFQDTLFVSTSSASGGLYKLIPAKDTGKKAKLELQNEEWTLQMDASDKRLVAIGVDSHKVYENGKWIQPEAFQINGDYFYSVTKSELVERRFYFGGVSALWSAQVDDEGRWQLKKIIDINHRAENIVEMNDGTLWLGARSTEVRKVTFASHKDFLQLRNPVLEKFGEKDGLPDEVLLPFKIEKEVYLSALSESDKSELFTYESSTNSFHKDSTLANRLGVTDERIVLKHVDDQNNIFFSVVKDGYFPKYVAWYQNGNFKTQRFKTDIEGDTRNAFLGYFEASDSVVWSRFYGTKLHRYDLTKDKFNRRTERALIKNVTYQGDSVVFGGYLSKNYSAPNLDFERNALRFNYILTEYDAIESQKFQYRLEGFDEEWSNWTSETQKDYTNLPEGDYTFRVRARTVFGQISEEDRYHFTILPPWYRTWWAYLLYALLGGMAIWGLVRWRSNQLQRKNLILEGIVKQRTQEISEKNKLLKYQTNRLRELDSMKTRLFANISHEFRTPLTLIKGPVEKLESSGGNTISTTNIKMIRRNANRLLNLVNQLLDLSKLDSGKLRLDKAEGDVFKCIRAAASSFSSHAASRKMDYRVKIPSRLLWAEFDRDKLEKIVYNLLSNAFKFTTDEGRVVVDVAYRSERLNIKVSDTGMGIAKEKLPHIFDRFFQVDDSYTRKKAGSGIGLALTKELVDLMGGTIYVESELGEGTSFRVVVPMEEIKSGPTDAIEALEVTSLDSQELLKNKVVNTTLGSNVLVIEDNNDMRHFIREQLEGNYGIIEAVNGKEGLKMAQKQSPDLIVTDLMMPQMDGITLTKKLKTDITTSHIPVIMLTAKAGLENKLEGLETGADEYLTKPFNARELQLRAKNLIESRQQLRERFANNISLEPKEITVTSLDEQFLTGLMQLLEERYADSNFGVPQMQREMAFSKTQLHTKVKALTTHPPGELLRNFRLKRAAQLLSQGAGNISQIAYDTGFNSLSYFTRCFKAYFKKSPTEYLEQNS